MVQIDPNICEQYKLNMLIFKKKIQFYGVYKTLKKHRDIEKFKRKRFKIKLCKY